MINETGDLVLEKKQINVKIYGQMYHLKMPSLNQVESFSENLEKQESKGHDIKLMKDFMSKLGLPVDVSGEMAVDDFRDLCEFVIEKSKKKSQKNG